MRFEEHADSCDCDVVRSDVHDDSWDCAALKPAVHVAKDARLCIRLVFVVVRDAVANAKSLDALDS